MNQTHVTSAIHTKRLTLHLPTDCTRDAALMLAVLTDPDFMHFVRDSGVRDLAEARQTVLRGPIAYRAANGLGLCRITLNATDQDIGQMGLITREGLPAPDIGYALLPAWRGQGYAYEAANAVLKHARDVLQLPRVLALVNPDNSRSLAVLACLGFTFETMTHLPGVNHALRQFSIALQKDA